VNLLDTIAERLDTALQRLAAGDDLPTGQRYRLEGLLEAAVLTGVATREQLEALLRERYRQHFRRPLEDDLWPGWEEVHPFPTLPLYMARAPVRPGTAD
jgi:hypothetical protein